MEKQFIASLTPDTGVQSCFVVRQKALVPFRSKPGKFLDVTVGDRTGNIKARVWDDAEKIAECFDVGDVTFVEGVVEEYRGQLQIIASKIEPAGEDTYDLEDMIVQRGRPQKELLQWLEETIDRIEQPQLRALVDAFFDDDEFRKAFVRSHGGKVLHHAYPGGLLEHTLSVVEILLRVADVHPHLNRDLLITGGLLHDIGKVGELEGVAAADYTDTGRFIGHTVLGDRMLMRKIGQLEEFDSHLQDLLSHMMLSHHGQRKWGAPITPSTREACALHYADNLDARIQGFGQIIDEEVGGGNRWSGYHEMYETRIYLGPNTPGADRAPKTAARPENDGAVGADDGSAANAETAQNSDNDRLPI